MRQFQISDKDLRDVITQGLSSGADYVDIYFEHSATTSVSLLNGSENRASQNIDYGAGVRVVTGEKTGYAYTEVITPQSLMDAVKQASRISQTSAGNVSLPAFDCQPSLPLYYNNEGNILQPDGATIRYLVDYLRQMYELLRQADSRIDGVNASVLHKVKRFAVVNSLGQIIEEERPITNISVGCVITHEGRTEQSNENRSMLSSLDVLTPELQKELCDSLVGKLHFALTAKQVKGGEMAVVMGPGSTGVLLHEAIGHAFEADFVRRKESVFTDKLGKQICDSSINVVDDGTLPLMRGSIHFDDEGVQSQCTNLVTEGRLTSFIHDRISARFFDIEPTGNGRRESFRFMPLPRMRNTYMLAGHDTEEDLIASVKHGIYVKDLSNGQVMIGAGNYSFYVRSGYLIEDGRLTQPIKDVNIIGNGPQTLADIRGVASNMQLAPYIWHCGKGGQSCPVSCGMPSVLVEKLTVG